MQIQSLKTDLKRFLYQIRKPYIENITSKYIIGEKYRRIYHYHIRKTAGSSLNSVFWRLANLNLSQMKRREVICKKGLVFVRHNKKLIEQGNYFYANSHRAAFQLNLPPDTFTITILRNPIKRVLSYYKYLVWIRENIDNPRIYQEEPFFDHVFQETKFLGSSFDEFLDRIPRYILLNQLQMFSKSFNPEEAEEKILSCSAVCFTETFSEDLQKISRTLKLPIIERNERRFTPKSANIPHNLDRLYSIVEPEFILINKIKAEINKSI